MSSPCRRGPRPRRWRTCLNARSITIRRIDALRSQLPVRNDSQHEARDQLTADNHPYNDELQRAILTDGIARLEKQLDAAEKKARDAEASAREAKSALAEILLDKARSQKSAPEAARNGAAPSEREIQSLRAELESARRDIQQHASKLQDMRDEAAQELRGEYERRFNAARERMARELQRRLADAPAALALDATRHEAMATSDTRDAAASQHPPATARLRTVGTWSMEAMARPRFIVPLAAFAGGLLLGWTALPGKSDQSPIAEKEASRATQSAPVALAPTQESESVPPIVETPAAAPPAIAKAPAAPSRVIAETPSAVAEQALMPETPAESAEPAVAPELAEAHRALQERNAALILQVDELRALLGSASKRAKTAESALSDERKKTADLSRRAAAAERRQHDYARPGGAASADSPANPSADTEQTRETPFRNIE